MEAIVYLQLLQKDEGHPIFLPLLQCWFSVQTAVTPLVQLAAPEAHGGWVRSELVKTHLASGPVEIWLPHLTGLESTHICILKNNHG